MEFSQQEIKEMYNKEDGKLLLDFSDSRYLEYLRIINSTPEYKKILDEVPAEFSDLEKAYYIYVNLGRLLYENLNLAYNHLKNLGCYYDVIKENGIGNCRQMNELYLSMLKYKGIVSEYYFVRKPEGVEGIDLRHIDVITLIDGKRYMFNIKGDMANLRAGIRVSRFGFTDSKSRKIEQISTFLQKSGITTEIIEELLEMINFSNSQDILAKISLHEEKYGISEITTFLKNKIPKIKFMQQIEEEIGVLDVIPIKSKEDEEQVSIESLNKRVNNDGHYENLGCPFDFPLDEYSYFEDIIKLELIPRLVEKNSKLREDWLKVNNNPKDETFNHSLENDVDIIIDFITKITQEIDPDLLQEYVRMIISEVYKQRYKEGDKDFKVWTQKNIRLFRMASAEELENNNKNIPLRFILAIRKQKTSEDDEKYIFYELANKKVRKKCYKEFIKEMKEKGMKICSKFIIERKATSDELEI